MAEQTHYFLAVPIPGHIREMLSDWCNRLKDQFPFKSWVHPEDFHLTLAFLGQTEEVILERIQEEMQIISDQTNTFDLTMNGIGIFGREEAPRIFWAGVEGSEELNALQKKVHSVCTEIGFSLDNRPYNPHITLARRWKGQEDYKKLQIDLFNQSQENTSFRCEEIVLYQTHLKRTPKYEKISRFRFIE
ncbi:RNA 2',3'-cyclic phosphodiesterase [Litchfieldia salsa]|uniref:RNA 2',3'-cyclic phosphodiesterase n=1 Tax=Litchfieldia salsa TaxID=930152 RepID=A0A1H0P9A1_9BACI|nr:RNA 2',3'-cyclic phosphodiesterase [Litchfieldia salsa]SDP01239.1 2'-5' RNA ligase [Litchfieldia salsa]